MERIKKALEKARQEREGVVGARPGVRAPGGRQEELDGRIQYSQTQVVQVEQDHLQDGGIIVNADAADGSGAAYNMLRTQVLQRMTQNGWNTLAISSPGPNAGKTLTAINLAISMARELHHTVLLVDLDLRKPSVHKYFGLTPKLGINAFLSENVPIPDILVNPSIERLVLLPGRESVKNSSEFLASPKMAKLVADLKTRYPSRFILFDLPPLLSTDDAISFAPHVDCMLIVVEDGKTTRPELEEALALLKDVPVLGTVLNKSTESLSSYN
jgi:capsular exopolysaccharide synthesis family protein